MITWLRHADTWPASSGSSSGAHAFVATTTTPASISPTSVVTTRLPPAAASPIESTRAGAQYAAPDARSIAAVTAAG